jgi:hypothetical protein
MGSLERSSLRQFICKTSFIRGWPLVPITTAVPARCTSTAPFIAFAAPMRLRSSAPRVVGLYPPH